MKELYGSGSDAKPQATTEEAVKSIKLMLDQIVLASNLKVYRKDYGTEIGRVLHSQIDESVATYLRELRRVMYFDMMKFHTSSVVSSAHLDNNWPILTLRRHNMEDNELDSATTVTVSTRSEIQGTKRITAYSRTYVRKWFGPHRSTRVAKRKMMKVIGYALIDFTVYPIQPINYINLNVSVARHDWQDAILFGEQNEVHKG